MIPIAKILEKKVGKTLDGALIIPDGQNTIVMRSKLISNGYYLATSKEEVRCMIYNSQKPGWYKKLIKTFKNN